MNINLSEFTTLFINDLRKQYTGVSGQMSQFFDLDYSEKGSLDRILTEIRDKIAELSRIPTDDSQRIKEMMMNISKQYSDMESILYILLEKILVSFEVR